MAFAGILHQIDDLQYQNIELPEIKENEVLVQVKCAGICGSDIPRVKTKGTYTFPTIPGHEFAGIVFKKGNKASHLQVGDRVTVYPLIPCHSCTFCQSGKENLCDNYNYLGSRCDGGFAEYVKCPADNIIKIPEKVTFEEAALVEPMAVALRGVKRSHIKSGDKVVIFGLGPIGLFAAQWAKLRGAKVILGVDRNKHKLEIAQRVGLDYALNSSDDRLDVNMKELIGSEGPDVVLECSGSNEFQEKAIALVKKSGTISFIGNPAGNVVFQEKYFQLILRKEVTLIGSWNSLITSAENEWKEVVEHLALGTIHVFPIITHRFKLSEIKEVFDNLHLKKYDRYCKGIFLMG